MMISMFHGCNTCLPMIQGDNPSVFSNQKLCKSTPFLMQTVASVECEYTRTCYCACAISCCTPCQALVDCQSQYKVLESQTPESPEQLKSDAAPISCE